MSINEPERQEGTDTELPPDDRTPTEAGRCDATTYAVMEQYDWGGRATATAYPNDGDRRVVQIEFQGEWGSAGGALPPAVARQFAQDVLAAADALDGGDA